jgi:flagellar basal body-associated protein FliL
VGWRIKMMVFMIVVMRLMHITMVMFVSMMPKLGLVEQKEKQQAEQQGHKQVVRLYTRLEGFRQQM